MVFGLQYVSQTLELTKVKARVLGMRYLWAKLGI